jgi:lipopolysaccharide transport system ATP-binding protein
MSDIAIHASGVSKQYRLGVRGEAGNYRTLTEAITGLFTAPWRRRRRASNRSRSLFWALKDVSFDVHHGEALGIIGRNGAGKSTLLKILSRITKPTEGRVGIYGRVGALLEVGTGFHHELTGRENIYLSGAVLGMRRAEIRRKFDEIVSFAEVERFIDTPVKRYSSGMYMRLAFAVAAHLEPDILIVDEVLAVGDVEFQKKCFGKMSDVAHQGRTILFVSHNLSALANLCPKAFWLDQGQIKDYGDSSTVIQNYVSNRTLGGDLDLTNHPGRHGAHALIRRVRLTSDDLPTATFRSTGPFSFEVECAVDPTIMKQMSLGFNIRDYLGTVLFASHLNQYQEEVQATGETILIQVVIDPLPLAPGSYQLSLYLATGASNIDIVEDAASFDVVWDQNIGLIYPPLPGWGPLFVPVDWRVPENNDTRTD